MSESSKRLPGTYLVDIQRIWEGYDGRWVNEAPLLLRFETIDVVLAPHHDNENINVWTGYLDTNAPVYEARNNSAENKQANEKASVKIPESFRPLIRVTIINKNKELNAFAVVPIIFHMTFFFVLFPILTPLYIFLY